MTNTIKNRYTPDYVSPPGETLSEILEEKEMSQAELAERMGRPKKTINEIIKGKAEITPETALQLERVLGVPAKFWNERERFYREFLARQNENKHLMEKASFLKRFPYKKMIQFNWIQSYTDTVEQLKELLNFFSVASPEQWEDIWSKSLSVDFRKSQVFESDGEAISAWLRRGEIEGAKIDCADYDADKFRETLQKIRSLTVEPIKVFQPQMVKLCADSGVALVFVPELPKTRVCGATRWLSPNKALIQLSDRYKMNDHFWFSFFHESGHILLHGKRDVFIEMKEREDTDKEKEANTFAANLLVNPIDWERFKNSNLRSKEAICQFAKEVGLAPGIIVGRLQHQEKTLPPSHCNDLKERIDWTQKEND